MFEDFDFDILGFFHRKLVQKTLGDAKVLVDIYSAEANKKKLKRALEEKYRNASSNTEKRVWKKMLQDL